jgi:hemerythrin
MSYEWSSDLETGYKSIDDQHKQLVESLNELLRACQHGDHRDELKKNLKFLVDYAVKHFDDEEAFQLKYNYPDYEWHKKLHEAYKDQASDLAKRLVKKGPTIALVAEAKSTLGDWLISHIKGEDIKMARHIRGQS